MIDCPAGTSFDPIMNCNCSPNAFIRPYFPDWATVEQVNASMNPNAAAICQGTAQADPDFDMSICQKCIPPEAASNYGPYFL